MDRTDKVLSKLTKKERAWVKDILKKVESGDFEGLDCKKLKGVDDIFRVRKGKIRIIYRSTEGDIHVLVIERRSDDTYKNL